MALRKCGSLGGCVDQVRLWCCEGVLRACARAKSAPRARPRRRHRDRKVSPPRRGDCGRCRRTPPMAQYGPRSPTLCLAPDIACTGAPRRVHRCTKADSQWLALPQGTLHANARGRGKPCGGGGGGCGGGGCQQPACCAASQCWHGSGLQGTRQAVTGGKQVPAGLSSGWLASREEIFRH